MEIVWFLGIIVKVGDGEVGVEKMRDETTIKVVNMSTAIQGEVAEAEMKSRNKTWRRYITERERD